MLPPSSTFVDLSDPNIWMIGPISVRRCVDGHEQRMSLKFHDLVRDVWRDPSFPLNYSLYDRNHFFPDPVSLKWMVWSKVNMSNIQHIKDFGLDSEAEKDTDKSVRELFNGSFRGIVEVRLGNHAVLSKHKADVPITVFCYSGAGRFLAGSQLEDSMDLIPGTLITLEAGIEHEVIAEPEIHILVTKFKAS